MKKFFLKGNILCALPQLKDIFFSKSLIYLTPQAEIWNGRMATVGIGIIFIIIALISQFS